MTNQPDGGEQQWHKEHLGPDSPFAQHYLFWAVRDDYSRLAFTAAEIDADRIIADHAAALKAEQSREPVHVCARCGKPNSYHTTMGANDIPYDDQDGHEYISTRWQDWQRKLEQTEAALRVALMALEKIRQDAAQSYERSTWYRMADTALAHPAIASLRGEK